MSCEVIVIRDADALAQRGADLFEGAVSDSVRLRGRAMVALAGGSTPERMYGVLAARKIDWSRVYLFFGDERFVAADDPVSNYGMAARSLIVPAGIPAEHVFPVPTGLASAELAAHEYEGILRQEFNVVGEPPRFDLVLLGLGDDGHTASLFPGASSLEVTDKLVVSSPPGTLPPPIERITFTYPILNAAREVMFLVSGAQKAVALHAVLKESPSCDERPAACVRLAEGRVTWVVDKAAIGDLPSLT